VTLQLEVNGTTLFFDVDGPGWVPEGPALVQRPTLLLLHGGPGGDHSLFKPLFQRLTDIAQVVFLDHRGNGRSAVGRPDEWTLDTWVEDIRCFCDALAIDRPVVLGMSFGGMVAMRFASRYPDRLQALVLASTFARRRDELVVEAFRRRGGDRAAEAARIFFADPFAGAGDYISLCLPLYEVGPKDPLAGGRQVVRQEVALHFIAGENRTVNLLPELTNVQCPVLLLAGQQDPVVPVEMLEEIEGALTAADVEIEVFPDAGHGVYGDAPDAFIERVRTFIQATHGAR